MTHPSAVSIRTNLTIVPNGGVVIPVDMRAKLGLPIAGEIIARLVDGAIVLEPLDIVICQAQAMVAKYISPGQNLVEELIAERHEAAIGE